MADVVNCKQEINRRDESHVLFALTIKPWDGTIRFQRMTLFC